MHASVDLVWLSYEKVWRAAEMYLLYVPRTLIHTSFEPFELLTFVCAYSLKCFKLFFLI